MLRFISAVSLKVDGEAAFISKPGSFRDESSGLALEVTLEVKGEFP